MYNKLTETLKQNLYLSFAEPKLGVGEVEKAGGDYVGRGTR